MTTIAFLISVPGGDFATLGKLYSFIAENRLKADVSGSADDGPTTGAQPHAEPLERRQPGRPRSIKLRSAFPASEVGVAAAAVSPPPSPDGATPDFTNSFTRHKAGQKDSRGRGKFFTAVQVKEWMPRWEAAKAAYLAAVPAERHLKGTQIMHLSIAELYALAGREPESEESPVASIAPPAKRKAGRPRGSKNKASSETPKRGPGRPSKTPKSPNAKRITLRKKKAA